MTEWRNKDAGTKRLWEREGGVGGYSSLWILHGIIPQSERLALKMSGLVTEKRPILRGRWGPFRQPCLWLHAAAIVDGNYRARERSQCQSDFMWELEVELERCGGEDKDLKLCWGISCISYVLHVLYMLVIYTSQKLKCKLNFSDFVLFRLNLLSSTVSF